MKLLLTCAPGLEPSNKAHLVVLDWEKREVIDSLEITHEVYKTSHKGFAGGSIVDGKLIVTGEAELFEFGLKPLSLLRRTTHETMNDGHHVCYHKGHYYVANAGMDSLEVFDENFKHVKSILLYPTFGFDFAHLKRLMRDDLRRWRQKKGGGYHFYDHLTKRYPFKNVFKVLNPDFFHGRKRDVRFTDFRPHVLHPNHCHSVGDDLWVTLWRPGVVMNVETGEQIARELGRPHDGHLFGDELMVTDCTTNKLFRYKMEMNGHVKAKGQRDVKVVTDTLEGGFLRGCTASDDTVYVGLTARRKTEKYKHARVVALERKGLNVVDDWELPHDFGKQIYSVIDVSEVY